MNEYIDKETFDEMNKMANEALEAVLEAKKEHPR